MKWLTKKIAEIRTVMENRVFARLSLALSMVALVDCGEKKVRLYAPATKKISVKKGKVVLSWCSSIKGARWRANGAPIVAVEIPEALLFGCESVYFSGDGYRAYSLKRSALRYAKRSCKLVAAQ